MKAFKSLCSGSCTSPMREFGPPVIDDVLEGEFLPREREVLEVFMSREDDRRRRVLVDLPCLQTEDPVLDHVVPADAMPSCDGVQPFDEIVARHVLPVQRNRDPFQKLDLDLLRRIGSILERCGPCVDLLGG